MDQGNVSALWQVLKNTDNRPWVLFYLHGDKNLDNQVMSLRCQAQYKRAITPIWTVHRSQSSKDEDFLNSFFTDTLIYYEKSGWISLALKPRQDCCRSLAGRKD